MMSMAVVSSGGPEIVGLLPPPTRIMESRL
jgi:hypothetical protein